MKKQITTTAAILLGLFFCGHCGMSATALAEDGVRIYEAKCGDNFIMLASRTGYDSELLAAMNNLSVGYSCHGGEVLRLPQEISPVRIAPASRSGVAIRNTIHQAWHAPVSGIITSRFASSRSGNPHHGIDIATNEGTAILAAHSGTVIESGWKNSIYGNSVLIDHGNGWQTHYAHCSKVLVKVGDFVRQGQKIALVGSTGNSTGPHLHLELIKDGVYLNPNAYFSDLSV